MDRQQAFTVQHRELYLIAYCCCYQSLGSLQLFVTPGTAAHQASLSFIIPQSLLTLMSIELVMTSSHLIICCPLLLLPSVFPSIRVFSIMEKNMKKKCVCVYMFINIYIYIYIYIYIMWRIPLWLRQ